MLSKINDLKISSAFIFCIVILFPWISNAQQKSSCILELGDLIQAKTSYNKKNVRRETRSLNSFITKNALIDLNPQKIASKDLRDIFRCELQTDTVISICAETENLCELITEKFEELKYDDNYYLENFSDHGRTDHLAVFIDIYKRVRILFIKLKDAQYCIID